jgi:hypothetical protein
VFRLYGRTAPDRRAEWVVATYGDTLHTSTNPADARELTAADALVAADLAYRRGFAEVRADAPRMAWTPDGDTYHHVTGRLTIPRCKARQYSDQMQCPCGLAWDVNDPEPPTCPNTEE